MVHTLDVVVGSVLATVPFIAAHGRLPVDITLLKYTAEAVLDGNTTHLLDPSVISHEVLPAVSGLFANTIVFVYILVSMALWQAYRSLQAPLDIWRKPNEPRRSRDQKAAEFPPPFPNGWFHVCLSQNLAKGQVKELDLFGQKLVLFRGEDGVSSVLDGFCPHLGANLGVAGEVNKNCLKCCFHGWEFDKNGACTGIAGASVIPPGASLRKWPSEEKNGSIYVWHDAENREPTWRVDDIDDINSGKYYCSGKTWSHVNAHVQELPENGPDCAHFNVLHKAFVWKRIPWGVEHVWTGDWKPMEGVAHKSYIYLTQCLTIFGVRIPGTSVVAHINQIGPGIVMLHLTTPLGKLYTFEYVTPSKTTTQVVEHTMYCAPTVPRFMGKLFLWSLEAQFQRDTPIWETKKFLKKPIISKADGPIMAFRRWYAQFYSESSVSFADALAKESMMDW